MKTYIGNVEHLEKNQIFVFGSNTQGRHGRGAASWAFFNAGAIYGRPTGIQGQSYAIITKDLTKKLHPSIPKRMIIMQIIRLYEYAKNHPKLEFLVAYKNEPSLNGYAPQQMADMFKSMEIPDNIVFEKEFAKLLNV